MSDGGAVRERDGLSRLITWLALGTVWVLSLVLAQQRSALGNLAMDRERTREMAHLEMLRGRHLGWPLPGGLDLQPLDAAVGWDPMGDMGAGAVFWIVDPNECRICSEEARRLGRTVLAAYPHVNIVVSGASVGVDDSLRVAWDLRGTIHADPDQSLRSQMLLAMPSTFLVVDRRGVIVHVEAHRADETCRTDVLELARRLLEPGARDSPRDTISLQREVSS
jgi:hypothetical protein